VFLPQIKYTGNGYLSAINKKETMQPKVQTNLFTTNHPIPFEGEKNG